MTQLLIFAMTQKNKQPKSLWLGPNLFLTGHSTNMSAVQNVFNMFYRALPEKVINQKINAHSPLIKGAVLTLKNNIRFALNNSELAWQPGNLVDLVTFAWLLDFCIYVYTFDEQPAYFVGHEKARDDIAFLRSGSVWFPLLTMMRLTAFQIPKIWARRCMQSLSWYIWAKKRF